MDASVERQTEINEWTYNSKRETLFFSQLVFIGLSILIIMFALSKAGLLGEILVLYVMIIVFVLLAVIWYTRYVYTRNNRSGQHWNRLSFSEDGKKPSTLSSSVLSSVATSTTSRCSGQSVGGASTGGTPPGGQQGSSDQYSWLFGPRSEMHSPSGSSNHVPQHWESSTEFPQHPEDVTTNNLNTIAEQQGMAYGLIRPDLLDRVAAAGSTPADTTSVAYRTEWCLNHPGAYELLSGMPCKQYWCTANPTKSWKDPTTSVSVACKTLFPNLVVG